MRTVDLTRVLHGRMPLYPGTRPPVLSDEYTLESDKFRETRLEFSSHTGTHIDAPAHLLPTARTLDQLPPETFLGRACVIDCRGRSIIGADLIESARGRGAEFLLFLTGWEDKWGQAAYFEGYPVFDDACVDSILSLRLKGVGIDTMSIDPVGFVRQPNHIRILGAGMIIIENMCNLAHIGEECALCALPLLYPAADGAPCRAVAVINQPKI